MAGPSRTISLESGPPGSTAIMHADASRPAIGAKQPPLAWRTDAVAIESPYQAEPGPAWVDSQLVETFPDPFEMADDRGVARVRLNPFVVLLQLGGGETAVAACERLGGGDEQRIVERCHGKSAERLVSISPSGRDQPRFAACRRYVRTCGNTS